MRSVVFFFLEIVRYGKSLKNMGASRTHSRLRQIQIAIGTKIVVPGAPDHDSTATTEGGVTAVSKQTSEASMAGERIIEARSRLFIMKTDQKYPYHGRILSLLRMARKAVGSNASTDALLSVGARGGAGLLCSIVNIYGSFFDHE